MIEEIRKLLRLEEIDLRIREAQRELAAFPAEREAAEQAAAVDRQAIAAARALLEEREGVHRQLETELQDADQLVEKLDAQVYEVTSKQAMEAIQSELAAAKGRKSDLEDRTLEVLDALDEAGTGIEEAEKQERERTAERESAETARSARETELHATLESLETARAEAAGSVLAEALQRYEDSRRKAWPVLAKVETKSCPACRIVIGAQKWNEINVGTKLATCGSCHRILYGDKV